MPVLNERDAAAYLGVSQSFLRQSRTKSKRDCDAPAWLKFNRATSKPLRMSCRIVSSSWLAGPIVQTIFVQRYISDCSSSGCEKRCGRIEFASVLSKEIMRFGKPVDGTIYALSRQDSNDFKYNLESGQNTREKWFPILYVRRSWFVEQIDLFHTRCAVLCF